MKSKKPLHTWGSKGVGKNPKSGDCKLSAKWKNGDRKLGRTMGSFWHAHPNSKMVKKLRICYAGVVTIGMVPHHLGVVAWKPWIFLSRYNEIWKLDGASLDDGNRIPPPGGLKPPQQKIWADGIARLVADALTPKKELIIMNEAKRRYHALVAALVNERCIKAATYGRKRTPTAYAKGVSGDWVAADLLRPREPTLMHALMTALVLALPAERASELIKLGAWLEYRIPLFNSESSMALYHNACWQLSRLCPTWHAESFLCDWNLLGPLDSMFYNQFLRTMGVASARELPIESIAGCGVNYGAEAPEWRTDASRCSSFTVESEEQARHKMYEEEWEE